MAERSTARTLRGVVIWIAAIALALLAAGLAYEAVGEAGDRRRYGPPGERVDVGGYRMHIYCTGDGSPTVVLDTISAGASPYWGWVQPELAATTRVCSYDRAGWGWSDDGPLPRDAERVVSELHTLLERAGVEGPVVLVGHSLGGLYARHFAATHRDEVAGLVLVESPHPDQNDHLPAEDLAAERSFARLMPTLTFLNRVGVSRLYVATGGTFDMTGLPDRQRAEALAFWSTPRYWASLRREASARAATDAQVRAGGHLGDLPLAVVSAPVGASPAWLALQSELTGLSDDAIHLSVDGATHTSLAFDRDDARATVRAVLDVVEAVREGRAIAASGRD
jgi:pimeloyl-ACP methyl ester carboxylesterase